MNILKKIFSIKISFSNYLLTIFILLFLSILFAAAVNHSKGMGPGGRFENIEKFVLILAKLPFDTIDFLKNKDFDVYFHKDKNIGFHYYADEKSILNGYILLPIYDLEKNKAKVELYDINKKETIHTWIANIDEILKLSKIDRNINNLERDQNQKRYIYRHPYLLKNGDLIFAAHNTPLTRIDKCSKLKWISDDFFHHSIESDNNGFIWTHLSTVGGEFKSFHDEYDDDLIAKVNIETGEIVYKKSITNIFIENDLKHLFTSAYVGKDPLHSNDIQPVLSNSDYWEKGDLFISLRHISTAFLYRPSENKVIWFKQGPWRYNHDIDIIDEKTIAIFNNNNSLGNKNDPLQSNVLFYNFESNKVYSPFEKLFSKTNFSTGASGLFTVIGKNEIIAEETVRSRIIMGNIDGELKWEFIWNSHLNWSRYLENEGYDSTADMLRNTKC